MWEIDSYKLKSPRVALIEGDQDDLEFYDVPILFTGFTALENRVVGSLVGFDRINNTENYLHAIVDEGTFSRFVHRKINYPETLRNAYYLYLVQWYDASKDPRVYEITFDEIPLKFKPKEEGYCPEIPHRPSLIFPMILRGQNANRHEVSAEFIAELHEQFTSIFHSPHKRMGNIEATVRLQAQPGTSQAYGASSFKFNYLVHLDERQGSFWKTEEDYAQYTNDYISYCLNDLPSDVARLDETALESNPRLLALWNQHSKLKGVTPQQVESAKKNFIADIIGVATKLEEVSETVGNDYNEIVLTNHSTSGDKHLGVIDQRYKEDLSQSLETLEAKRGETKETDTKPQRYRIHIFDLNTTTRKGRAFHEHPNPNKVAKPTITIAGDSPLEKTKYTESLDEGSFIEVLGLATKVDKVVRRIDIIFEP